MTLKIVQGYCKSFTNRNVIHVSEAEQVERNICSKKRFLIMNVSVSLEKWLKNKYICFIPYQHALFR